MLLVFVDVMKELPATLVLRPFNFDTLATQSICRQGRAARGSRTAVADDRAVGLVPIVALGADRPRAAKRRACSARREATAG